MEYIKNVEIRWSDLDPNFHLRHSCYYDFGAYSRLAFLHENGISDALMQEHFIGPILFREECFFKREIVMGDKVSVSLKLRAVSSDFRKFFMQHEIIKNNNEVAAIINVDGAWMHTKLRKIVAPPAIIIDSLQTIPKTDDFAII